MMSYQETNLQNNSLLKITKTILSKNIFENVIKNFNIFQKCFLIVDTKGAKLIDTYFTMSEIINKGILSIEYIYKTRKPYPNYSAIYLISNPSISHMKQDFEKEKKIYKDCHIFIIDKITNDSYDLMCDKNFVSYIKTLKQVSLEYTVLDRNIFSYGDNINYNSIYNLYSNNDEIININIINLSNLCQVMDIYPNIVYCNFDKNCKILAEGVNKKLKNFF